jgi:hypothetical protein
MKKILIILLFPAFTKAQLWQMTFGAQIYKQTGSTIGSFDPGSLQGNIYSAHTVKEKGWVPMAGVYYYYPFYSSRDLFSLGAEAGFGFWGSYQSPDEIQNQYGAQIGTTGGSPLKIGYQFPILAMARLGAGSTADSEKPIGFALGTGIMPTGFNVPLEKGFYAPIVLASEITYNQFGLRIEFPFKGYQSVYNSYVGEIPRIKTRFISIQLLARWK